MNHQVDGISVKVLICILEAYRISGLRPHQHYQCFDYCFFFRIKKGKRKAQGVPQSQTAALPRPQEEEEIDKSKQAQTEQTYEKH